MKNIIVLSAYKFEKMKRNEPIEDLFVQIKRKELEKREKDENLKKVKARQDNNTNIKKAYNENVKGS